MDYLIEKGFFMLQYPSIASVGTSKISKGTMCHSFVKYDGSNIRFEWTKKQGFHKFGSRHHLIDKTHPMLGESIEIVQDLTGPALLRDLINWDKRLINNAGEFTGFAEFFGKSSFAGNHVADEEHFMKVFDVSIYKKGFLKPNELCEFALSEHYAKLLGIVPYNESYMDSIFKGDGLDQADYIQTIAEGVILKAVVKNQVQRIKLKTKVWLDEIKAKCENWEELV